MISSSRTFALVVALAIAFGTLHTLAIVFGVVDSTNRFSNVGAFVVQSPNGRNAPICTGTLVAPDVFLTASHCTVYFERELQPAGYTAYVSFDPLIPWGSLTSPSTVLIPVNTVVTNPNYTWAQNDVGDIAVLLVSATDTTGITPAPLPPAGWLDELNFQNGLKDATFTAVGYGVQDRVVGGGTPYFNDANPVPRMYAVESFDALNHTFLRLSQNPATGNGGACYGDSGGPNFLNTSDGPRLVAITITGDAVCRATNVVYRLDTPSARAFLASFVTLP